MILKHGTTHQHKFEPAPPQKVQLRNRYGTRTANYDLLKQRRCACGAIETYDLERYVIEGRGL